MYDSGRYFAVTGNRLTDIPSTIEERDLTELYNQVRKRPAQPANFVSGKKIPNGRRNDFLKRYAGKLIRVGIGHEALTTELLRINRELFAEPKDESTIRKQSVGASRAARA